MRPSAIQILRTDNVWAGVGWVIVLALWVLATLELGCFGSMLSDFLGCFFAMAFTSFYYVKSI